MAILKLECLVKVVVESLVAANVTAVRFSSVELTVVKQQ